MHTNDVTNTFLFVLKMSQILGSGGTFQIAKKRLILFTQKRKMTENEIEVI